MGLLSGIFATLGLSCLFSEDKDDFNTLKNVKLGQEGYVKWLGRLRRITVYSGLGKEARFNGVIGNVTDYINPRYVYADLAESEELTNNHGSIIGYRISPTLVISSMVGINYLKDEICEFIRDFGGNLLVGDELKVFRANFAVISKMRKVAGDTPLPEGLFWVKTCGNVIEATHALVPYEDDERAKLANIILKR